MKSLGRSVKAKKKDTYSDSGRKEIGYSFD